MATEVTDWDSFGGKEGKGKTRYIKFEDGQTVEVRPVGRIYEFAKFFVKGKEGNRSVVVDLALADEAAEILSKHEGKEVKYSHRYAVNVIDRADNIIKVLEGGRSIFKYFAAWAKRHGASPGGNTGFNWEITATGKGLNREYTTQPIGPSPVSAEEKARYKANGDFFSIEEIYATVPLNKLIEKAFGEKKSEPEPESEVQEAVAAETGVGEVEDVGW
jgi:hypothetical protein